MDHNRKYIYASRDASNSKRSSVSFSEKNGRFSLGTRENSVFSDLHKLIPADVLMELKSLVNLAALRLHGNSIQSFSPALISFYPRLKYLELFGSGAGGTPHMEQQIVHNGVLDD